MSAAEHEKIGNFEPEANDYFGEPAKSEAVALVSIAISLKRIADALNYTPGHYNLYDMLNDIRHNTVPRR